MSIRCSVARASWKGSVIGDGELPDAWWFRPDGHKMTRSDWDEGEPALGLFLNGDAIPSPGPHGERVRDDSFVLLFNACSDEREFMLPRERMGLVWELELSTAGRAGSEFGGAGSDSARHDAHTAVTLPSHSMLVLRRAE